MSAIKDVQAPGEGAHGREAAAYRAGYEAALRRGAGCRSPYAERSGLTVQMWEARRGAWATGYARGLADRAAGQTYANWQATAPRVVPRQQKQQAGRGLKPAPGEETVRVFTRSAYRKGYAAAEQGKRITDNPHSLAGAGAAFDQLTVELRGAWDKGFRAYQPAAVTKKGVESVRATG
jgi:hypothetical protein